MLADPSSAVRDTVVLSSSPQERQKAVDTWFNRSTEAVISPSSGFQMLSGVDSFMTRYCFRHYRRNSHDDLIGTLIARRSCGAADTAAAIQHAQLNFLGDFHAETDTADLSTENGKIVWQMPRTH